MAKKRKTTYKTSQGKSKNIKHLVLKGYNYNKKIGLIKKR